MKEETRGRKLKFKTVKKLQDAIDEYFLFCDNRIVHYYSPKNDCVVDTVDPAPYTMSGLARTIGISRQCLSKYSHRDLYSDTIKAAREKVHENVETRLMERQATGAIFNLKNNFGWKDETKVEQSGKIEIEAYKRLSDEELDALIIKQTKTNESEEERKALVAHNGKENKKGK